MMKVCSSISKKATQANVTKGLILQDSRVHGKGAYDADAMAYLAKNEIC